jgi:hypothetical protein
MANDDYYGAPTDSGIQTLGQRLREYYDPEDFVTVINIDITPITYQFAHPTDTETFSDYPGHKDTVQKRVPQRVTLNPGETKLCPAYEADLMIENLIKQMATKSTAREINDGKAVAWQSTNWTDPTLQNKLIKQIFLGKKDVVGQYNSNLDKPKSDIEEDLDVSNKSGRPAKALQGA